jgi:hypothetical protein
MQSFTIDMSINIPIILVLISFLYGAGVFTQKVLSSLKAIETIANSVKTLEMKIARLEIHTDFLDHSDHNRGLLDNE